MSARPQEFINFPSDDDGLRLARILMPTKRAFDTPEEWAAFLGDLFDFIIDCTCEGAQEDSTMHKLEIGRRLRQGMGHE